MKKEYLVIAMYENDKKEMVYNLHGGHYKVTTLEDAKELVQIHKQRVLECETSENGKILFRGLQIEFKRPLRYEIKFREIPEYEVIETIEA